MQDSLVRSEGLQELVFFEAAGYFPSESDTCLRSGLRSLCFFRSAPDTEPANASREHLLPDADGIVAGGSGAFVICPAAEDSLTGIAEGTLATSEGITSGETPLKLILQAHLTSEFDTRILGCC